MFLRKTGFQQHGLSKLSL